MIRRMIKPSCAVADTLLYPLYMHKLVSFLSDISVNDQIRHDSDGFGTIGSLTVFNHETRKQIEHDLMQENSMDIKIEYLEATIELEIRKIFTSTVDMPQCITSTDHRTLND